MASASPRLIASCLLLTMLISCLPSEASRVFLVGYDFGWRVPPDNDTAIYSHWATGNRFSVGDSLNFVYQNDSVIEVDKWGYYHCNASDSITAFDNGNSTFNLDRPGFFFFISGTPGHCREGQRLIVEVMHPHHPISASPAASALPPGQYSILAPSPLSGPSSKAPLSVPLSWAILALAAVSQFMLS